MRAKIITSKKTIYSQSISKDTSKDVTSFLSDRFYSVNQNHNSAIIIGSSLSSQEKDMDQDTILDNSGVLITTDKAGVISGARSAVTDGLGGGCGDQEEDDEIYSVAYSTCDGFLSCNENIDTTLNLINQLTSSSKQQKSQIDPAHASLAAFIYKFNQQEGYFGEFANIGDGLIIVLDKQCKIKDILNARHIYRGFGNWTSASVQMLPSTTKREDVLIKQTIKLAEGDIIISMTDGIWGELTSNLVCQTETRRDIGIDKKAFEALLDVLIDMPYPSSFDIAHIIAKHSMSRSLERRKTLVNLINEIEKQGFKEKSIKTISKVLDYFVATGNHETAKTLKSVLFEQALNDGIIYFENVEIPLDLVMIDLKRRTVGDCSTINVTRIPYRLDELIRSFINYPEHRQTLALQFMATIKSETELEEAFKRLSLEVIQSEVECKLSATHFEPVFKKETLDKTKILLTHFFRISIQLQSTTSYLNCLTCLSKYINDKTSLDKEDLSLLLSMLDNKIKPKTGFLSLFGENQKKLYKDFQEQIKPDLKAEIDTFSIT